MCTDDPGGAANRIGFETHGAIDFGLSGVVASLPDMFRFSDEPESRFFRMQGLALAAVTGLTDFSAIGERGRGKELDRRSRKEAGLANPHATGEHERSCHADGVQAVGNKSALDQAGHSLRIAANLVLESYAQEPIPLPESDRKHATKK